MAATAVLVGHLCGGCFESLFQPFAARGCFPRVLKASSRGRSIVACPRCRWLVPRMTVTCSHHEQCHELNRAAVFDGEVNVSCESAFSSAAQKSPRKAALNVAMGQVTLEKLTRLFQTQSSFLELL